jgi:hypothetical protein
MTSTRHTRTARFAAGGTLERAAKVLTVVTLLLVCTACPTGDLTQVIGTGHSYTTACSAEMAARGDSYEARCTPPSCARLYESVAVSHVIVGIDPGVRVVGFAERVCLRTVSDIAQIEEASRPSEEPAAPL